MPRSRSASVIALPVQSSIDFLNFESSATGIGLGISDLVRQGQAKTGGEEEGSWPTGEALADLRAGWRNQYPVQIIIPVLKARGQGVLAEETISAEGRGLGPLQRFVAVREANRKNKGGIDNFLGYLGAKIPQDLAAGLFLPLLGIGVTVFMPGLEYLNHEGAPFLKRVWQRAGGLENG